MGKSQKIIAVIVISLIVICFFLSIYITVEEEMPDNALVIITVEDKLYHSIHFDHICVNGKALKSMRLSQAREEGYKPHIYDHDLGYFRGNRRFLFHHMISKLGVQVNSRWDENGEWLW